MDYYDKLLIAQQLLSEQLSKHIFLIEIADIRPVLTVKFRQNFTLYVRYNRVGEYSYHIQFSAHDLDRIRFDNMDLNWKVRTHPHHFHPRNDSRGRDSEMIGDPNSDIPKLIEYIKSEILLE